MRIREAGMNRHGVTWSQMWNPDVISENQDGRSRLYRGKAHKE